MHDKPFSSGYIFLFVGILHVALCLKCFTNKCYQRLRMSLNWQCRIFQFSPFFSFFPHCSSWHPRLSIGQFSEAGLHKWMPFVIFRASSHERSQHHFRADFWVGIASCCVQQWKLSLELWITTNATTVAVAKSTGERGWRVEKKGLCVNFWLTRRSRVRGKKHFGASYSMSNKLLLVARHILTVGLQKCL